MKKIVYAIALIGTLAGVAICLQAMNGDDEMSQYNDDDDGYSTNYGGCGDDDE